jgi:hypothetical protein
MLNANNIKERRSELAQGLCTGTFYHPDIRVVSQSRDQIAPHRDAEKRQIGYSLI